jgi:hypothetical protein
MSPQYASAATMESIATLPATPSALFADNQQRLILLFTGDIGLGTLVNGAIETIATGPVTSAAPAPQGGIYFTRDGQLLHLDTLGTITEQSTSFTDPLQSKSRITLTPDQSWGAAHALGDRLIIAGGAHWSETHQTYIYEDRSFVLKAPPSKSR